MGDPSGCPRHPRVPPLLHFPRPAVRCPRLAWTRCSEGGGVKVLDGESTRITIISTSFFPPASVAGGNHFFGTMEKVSDVSPTPWRCLSACAKPGQYLSAWTLSSVITAVRGAKGKDSDVTSHSSAVSERLPGARECTSQLRPSPLQHPCPSVGVHVWVEPCLSRSVSYDL